MLQYKDGKFHVPGAAFALPEGFYLETEPEHCYERGFGAWTPDRRYYFEWEVERPCEGTRQELAALFSPLWGIPGSEDDIVPVLVNGLSGHQVRYMNHGTEYFEMRLALPARAELSIRVRAETGNILTGKVEPYLTAVCAHICGE